MGGAKWLKEQKGASLDIDELAPKPEPFNAAQSTTLAIVAILVLLVVVPGLPGKCLPTCFLTLVRFPSYFPSF